MSELLALDLTEKIRTTCPYCGVGCGVVATVDKEKRAVQVKGDPDHPANFGRLCSKGSALGETLSIQERLAYPKLNGQETTWDAALDHVSSKLKSIIEEHGPDSVMLYVSGQLLTEDYYVANKFAKGFIGTNNIDSNSRLCMSSAVAGYKRAFGSDTVPNSYEDIESSELFIICGSNMAWCHPVLFQRLKAAQKIDNKKIIVIDPRKTDSCAIADLHLKIKPGTDTILFNGLFAYLSKNNFLDKEYLTFCDGFEETLNTAMEFVELSKVAQLCEVDEADLHIFYDWFASIDKTVTFFSMGVNQSSAGTDKVNSIINCHAITGKIGKPGAGPFSITGQPNAMGGREVGALSNLLASHFDLSNPQHCESVQTFWNAPKKITSSIGVTATEAAESILDGKVKAIWIMATNPVVSLPNANKFVEALQKCDLTIVSDCSSQSDTIAFADVVLPAQGWSEKDGTVTNSERRISRQRKILPAFGEAKPDWWIVSQVAKRMGFDGFDYQQPFDIFKEHVALSAFENSGSRSFDLSSLMHMTEQAYNDFMPTQWPINGNKNTSRFFTQGETYNKTKKVNLLAINLRMPKSEVTEQFPLVLNTGRNRDQWHTMTRTGLAPRLNQHIPEPYVMLHSSDAVDHHVKNNDLVDVNSQQGCMTLRVKIDDAQRVGEVFSSMHWSNEFSKNARVGQLINANVDPVSLQPEFKFTPVKIVPIDIKCEALVLINLAECGQQYLELIGDIKYWTKTKQSFVQEYVLADDKVFNGLAFKEKLNSVLLHDHSLVFFNDVYEQSYRYVILDRDKVLAVLYFENKKEKLPSTNWIRSVFEKQLSEFDVSSNFLSQWLIAGQPAEGDFDIGRIVCSCFTVGEKTIRNTILDKACVSAADVGKYLNAGTNCGSCVPELEQIIKSIK